MTYLCAACHQLRDDTKKDEQKYTYRSSDRVVKLDVCYACHKAKLEAIKTAKTQVLGESAVTGELRTED